MVKEDEPCIYLEKEDQYYPIYEFQEEKNVDDEFNPIDFENIIDNF